ncbi:hypothetical protein P280DRAFT_509768 [Massarina eburnea CBS 473.64]|uniref:Rhodopsin domain-containing protein n=1 Tax=Massarina eburnea CBS 473.64 TaxID=1395130 RepID=A0A6A6RQ91_9PLEO|nr:hypothetical protein P280DRAFT_509768 [Massarina eburnea CBS 473.64]
MSDLVPVPDRALTGKGEASDENKTTDKRRVVTTFEWKLVRHVYSSSCTWSPSEILEMAENNATTVVGTMWTLNTVALVAIVARTYLKFQHGRAIAADDGMLWFSWCLLTIYTALTHVSTTYGLGYHFHDIPDEDLMPANKFLTIGEFFAVLALQASKTSFGITLLRLVTQRNLKWAIWFIIVTLNIVMGLDAIFVFASCTPTEKIWDPTLAGKCWKPEAVVNVSIFAGVYSGVMDLLLAVIPIFILKPLKMGVREKQAICFAMSLGIFAGIAAFVKSGYIPQLGRRDDVTFSSHRILIWAAAEASITIIATCVPYFRLTICHRAGTHPARGYEIQDEELHMSRVVLNLKDANGSSTEWTGLCEGKKVAVPEKVKRASGIMISNHSKSMSAGAESWDVHTDHLADSKS